MTLVGPPRSRVCSNVNWTLFRRHCTGDPADGDFLQHIKNSATAATIVTRVQPGRPVPDLRQLNLRASRRRAERRAIRTADQEGWTIYRRVDAVCRQHANQRRRRSWEGVCSSISSTTSSSTVWRLLRSLQQGPSLPQPIMAVAVSMGLTEKALANLLASHFASRPPVPLPDPASMVGGAAPHIVHHQDWTQEQVAALCNKSFQLHELTKALDRSRRRSAPGADGITFQMLRNLADAERARLLDCLNAVWTSGQLPEAMAAASAVALDEVRKDAAATVRALFVATATKAVVRVVVRG
ncbi:hypothetical protein HPB49_000738 [Dermacentor silvarum]|uniref:Uncharacterized protein n=1 Tax=Dermacentor silvarum TaxID=543639 RepID=A0ACB8DSS2_DERSI|nr:hypothetical protein HPB49_000738 [Dermacentor silvarum]